MRNLSSRDALLCLLSALLVSLVGCAAQSGGASNYERCLANERSCDEPRLSAMEREHIAESRRKRHFQDCLARLRCNEGSLSEQELRQVRETVSRLNFEACLRGEAACDERLLEDAERTAVYEAMRIRNKGNCMAGLVTCEEYYLNDTELAQMRAAYAQRNFSGCMNTVGTLVQCNPEDLTDEQREQVKRRQLAANYFLCANAAFGCVESLLTEEQRARLHSAAQGHK
jgi:hypothetical protein